MLFCLVVLCGVCIFSWLCFILFFFSSICSASFIIIFFSFFFFFFLYQLVTFLLSFYSYNSQIICSYCLTFYMHGYDMVNPCSSTNKAWSIKPFDRVSFQIINVALFVIWCMWDKKVIENFKKKRFKNVFMMQAKYYLR